MRRSCSGFRATTIWMVEQLGLAMMSLGMWRGRRRSPRGRPAARRGPCGMGRVVDHDAAGLPARGCARPISWRPARTSRCRHREVELLQILDFEVVWRRRTLRPTERSEASAITSLTGNFRSASVDSISRPTFPVAPMTATLYPIVANPYLVLAPNSPIRHELRCRMPVCKATNPEIRLYIPLRIHVYSAAIRKDRAST